MGGTGGFLAHGDEVAEAGGGGAIGVVFGGDDEEEVALGGDALVVAGDGELAVAHGVEAGGNGLATPVSPFFGEIDDGHEGALGDGGHGDGFLGGGGGLGGVGAEPDFGSGFASGGEDAEAGFGQKARDGGGESGGRGVHFLDPVAWEH